MTTQTSLILPECGLTKTDMKAATANLVDAVKDGTINPLHAKLKMKAIETVLKDAAAEIDSYARAEAETHGSKSFQVYGATVELIEAGAKYDFTNCGDPVYNELTKQAAEIAAQIKNREAFLKTVQGSMNIVTDDGEGVTVYPPVKSSTSTVKITFPK